MPLWLAIVLPALPLQLAARAIETVAPLAVIEGPPQRLQVAFCNDAARHAGITPGYRLAAAQALAANLIAVERKPERERDALAELAGWAYQFSAAVSVRDDGLLLETGGSRRLFGGRAPLNHEIAAQLHGLGYRAAFGEAAAPQAAWWLAQARGRGLTVASPIEPEQLPAALAPLPLAALGWPADTVDTLHALGLRTLHDLRQLPREGVNRRFGARLLAEGIEKRADLRSLRELGVEFGQGYLLGRPSPEPARPRRLDWSSAVASVTAPVRALADPSG